MPVDTIKECDNCGKDFPIDHERCPNCEMYRGEDPVEFNKFKDEEEQ